MLRARINGSKKQMITSIIHDSWALKNFLIATRGNGYLSGKLFMLSFKCAMKNFNIHMEN